MLRTILILIITLIVLPAVAITMDQPLEGPILDALLDILKVTLGVALFCFLLSEATGNYSQVDKLWSLLPIGYAWFFAWRSDLEPRLILMASLVTLWGIRLTWNFSRRGGYSWKFWAGEEDYRWAELRQMPMFSKKWRFTLFNLFFISLYQQHLILLFTLPALVAWQGADQPLGWLDYLAAALMLAFIWMETVADNQQYRFQTEKYRQIDAGEARTGDYADGFLQSGLWACFRHPNYTAEQAIWLSYYLFSVAATGRWLNWSLAGALLLLLLFQGSADFSEGISARKYPAYASYQKRVGRFLPKIF
ncbi:MAG: DUF1295 domain-containing protein [Saprospiraceae bacterium]